MAAALAAGAVLFVASSAFAGCSPQSHGEHTSRDMKEIGWMQTGKQAIKDRLKDGESARFKDVYFCRGSQDIPMTCGWVNAKNAFGAYTGFQRFISAGRPDATYLESQVSGFSGVWKALCR